MVVSLLMTPALQHPVADHKADDAPAILEMRGISQIFPGVKALDGVSIKLYPGKVTALIGENGAGKSTLVKILTGIYRPNEGEILIDGKPTTFASAQAAIDTGVTAIHQETVLFDDLSVAENIFLGHAPRTRFGTIDWRTMRKNAREVCASGERRNPNLLISNRTMRRTFWRAYCGA